MMITPVHSATLMSPEGHYVPAVIHGGCVYVSGTLPTSPLCPTPDSPIETQIRHLLYNCEDILQAAGSRKDLVIYLTLYMTDLSNWGIADKAVAQFFENHRPARSVLHVASIRKGYAVQASLIAAI